MNPNNPLQPAPIEYDIPHDFIYISPKFLDSSHPFYFVNRAGITAKTPVDFHIRRNASYGYNVIHCVTKGKGEVFARGERRQVYSGQLFLLGAHEPHDYKTDPADPLGLCWVEFSGGSSDNLCKLILDRMDPIIEGETFHRVLSLIAGILSSLQSQPSLTIGVDIYKILIELAELSQTASKRQQKSGGYDKIMRLENYIDEHLSSPLTLEQLAGELNYNTTYFARRFRQIMNTTPANYVMQKRISKAKYLLITTHDPLEAIAEALGFCNTSHFIARFKEYEKSTPSEYRKQNRYYQQYSSVPNE